METFNFDLCKIGYILAVKKLPKEFYGDAIEKIQLKKGYEKKDAEYTHVEILSGGNDSMRIMTPRAKPISLNDFYKGRYIKILKLKEYVPEKIRYKIALKYNLLCNKKYDKRGVLAFILPFIRQNPNKQFCSEGVCESYQHYVPEAFNNILPSRCFPATIVSDSNIDIHWEGKIE